MGRNECNYIKRGTFGRGCIIQAGSLVNKDVPPYKIAGGHPAKVFSSRNMDHYLKLKNNNKYY